MLRTRVLALMLAGLCMGSVYAAGAEPVTPNPANRQSVGFAQDTLANDWRRAQAEALRHAFSRHPQIQFTVTDGHGSTARQIRDIEDLVDRHIDLLITSPKDEVAMTPVVSAAFKSGTPVILLTRRIGSDDYTTYITPDDENIARRAARLIADRLNGKGRILVLQGVATATTAKTRTEAFLDEIAHFPGLTIAAIKPANYLRADAILAVEEVLAEGVAFDAIYSQSDSMASGARMALREAGIDPGSLIIVGIDYISEARDAIRRGEQTASFTYPVCAEEGVDAALRILRGEPVPKQILIRSTMVTVDNVDTIEPIF